MRDLLQTADSLINELYDRQRFMEQNKQFHKPRSKGIMLQLAEGDDDSEANASVSDEEELVRLKERRKLCGESGSGPDRPANGLSWPDPHGSLPTGIRR